MKKKNGKSQHRHSTTTTRPWPSSINNVQGTNALVLCFIFFFVGGFLLFTCLDMILMIAPETGAITYVFRVSSFQKASPTPQEKAEFPLRCTATPNITQTCPADYYPKTHNSTNSDRQSNVICPSYFKWIHEDLRPWRETGITRDMIERARRTAHFRLVIVDGRAYVEKYRQSIQTRDMITLWGILQLLRLYPGKVPDLELMFDCDDRPVVRSEDFPGPTAGPPPLFRYCADDTSLDIVFPDWSFWGWAEVNIKPWKSMLKGITKGSKRKKWKDRVPYAYWKGNPYVSANRGDLMTCNVSDKHDWNARLYAQDWGKEIRQKYKHSKLEDQCTHRYKIYIEGRAWSVSDKYILACDSMTLVVNPAYYDFFMRSMVPIQHYWPIRAKNKCKDIEFAVEWGNNHTDKAEAIGKGGSRFIQENLKMEYIYGYMFHLLKEYAKLLKFKPEIPKGGAEVCAESLACSENGLVRKFMKESMVMSPSSTLPCAMPPPYDPAALQQLLERRENITRQVVMWGNEYWQNSNHS
ncbi:KDEL motif-containing protein 1 precursor, putative [Ricinus communis]|uniref:KDEL motif-containing protein 1, putative n=1 Tax=Ricinus communis TaxID=3988 RepID=B9RDP6_RICCO|nr:KDEL motif-containing protein 1 precursor, putative [Ricinus communis]